MGTKLLVYGAKSITLKHAIAGGEQAAIIMVDLQKGEYASVNLYDLTADALDDGCRHYLAARGWMFIPEHKVAVQARGQSPAALADHVALARATDPDA